MSSLIPCRHVVLAFMLRVEWKEILSISMAASWAGSGCMMSLKIQNIFEVDDQTTVQYVW